jgi:uncharacterized membrane protein YqjE
VAHSVSQAQLTASSGTQDPSIGTLVQSAMADVSTLVRGEVELAKAEIGTSAKRAGLSVAFFAAAGVLAAFAGIYLFVMLAEALTALGLPRWVSYGIVTLLLLVLAGICALIGKRMVSKIEKPERTLETLSDLPDVLRREAPGQRHRAVPEVSNGKVALRGNESYKV